MSTGPQISQEMVDRLLSIIEPNEKKREHLKLKSRTSLRNNEIIIDQEIKSFSWKKNISILEDQIDEISKLGLKLFYIAGGGGCLYLKFKLKN
jgi:hypothetical protein